MTVCWDLKIDFKYLVAQGGAPAMCGKFNGCTAKKFSKISRCSFHRLCEIHTLNIYSGKWPVLSFPLYRNTLGCMNEIIKKKVSRVNEIESEYNEWNITIIDAVIYCLLVCKQKLTGKFIYGTLEKLLQNFITDWVFF